MNIKSNSKKQGPGFLKSAWLGFLEVLPEATGALKTAIFLGGIIAAYFMWDYSGMIALFFVVLGGILIVQDQWGDIGIGARLSFTLIAVVIVFWMGLSDVYFTQEKTIKVKYSKLIFTDSTEKIIIFMTYPEKRTVNQPLNTTQYYTLKDQEDNITMYITEKGTYDHWSMLDAKDNNDTSNPDVSEYSYGFTINSPAEAISNDDWLKSKDRKFVQDTNTSKEVK